MLMPPQTTLLRGLVLAYGAGTLTGQILILRELLVLCQGQELKLALGLWCWLFWTGLGSLGGGRLAARFSPRLNLLGILLCLLGLLLPGTILGARLLPGLLGLPAGQSLGPGAALLLFLVILAPFGLASGCFFPFACKVQSMSQPQGAIGRTYATEALGAAAGIGLLQIVLMGQFANLSLGLGAGLIIVLVAALLTRQKQFLLGVLVLGLALSLASRLDMQSRSWQWPGRQVAATVDSPYALLTATREKEQYSFFANHVWHFTHPDPASAEHAAHPALLEHPRPERVLLLGGGVAGLIPEILKHQSVKQLHYVELDPDLVRLAARLAPEAGRHLTGESRAAVFYQDARRFLASSEHRYDVILLNLPEPSNAQLNRFYSHEFFQIAARRLKPQGIFSFALSGGGSASLSPSRAAYLALGYNTLHRVFPEVLVLPGEQVRFFGSLSRGVLTGDPEVLAARLKERRLDLRYVREYYMLADLAPSRQQYLRAILSRQPVEVNSDLHPRGYFYDLLLTSAREGLPLPGVLFALRSLPVFIPWLVIGLALALIWVTPRKRAGLHSLTQVLVMGLGTMALEVTVLILYQVYLGYLYRQLGLLIAAFMAGLWAGGTWGARQGGDSLFLTRRLAALQGGLAALPLILAAILWSISRAPSLVLPELILQGGFICLLALAGFMGGGIFSLSASLWRQAHPDAALEGGLFYAVDLLGATLGTLGMSLIIVPIWGILPALFGLAALHALAAVLMARF